ncbi:hypothetical protein TSUD_331140 [Trifolium subterraneum]|uniref:Uncharacterized protein n=1 Tax=Trifolium subterraneum TaxID=3900 RepID=A0A2Z6LWI8_TRISU|nr:hypothetical protein TSUD_331140 [Trifolium subterraneum]
MGEELPQGKRQAPLRRKGAPMAEERPMKWGAAAKSFRSRKPYFSVDFGTESNGPSLLTPGGDCT